MSYAVLTGMSRCAAVSETQIPRRITSMTSISAVSARVGVPRWCSLLRCECANNVWPRGDDVATSAAAGRSDSAPREAQTARILRVRERDRRLHEHASQHASGTPKVKGEPKCSMPPDVLLKNNRKLNRVETTEIAGMGCCASTPAGQIKVLPRSYRRASLRAGPEPPAYYANMREGSSADLKNERVNRRSNTLRPDDSKLFSVLPRSTLGICKLATVTMVGMDPLNPRKTNQDNLFCDASYVDEKSVHLAASRGLFVVFDGHGTYGHQVSTFLANSLPHALCEKLKNAPRSFKSAFALGDFNGAWQKTELEKLVKGVFTTINKALQQSPIQTRLSGSTCCSLLVANKKFITANIVARALTSDHKPTLPSEMERVLALGGR
ncbi:phosphatase 2C-like domain-containing protein [Pavlovales sp. CCMP2436]|nr:phosphatase 2C-like domain-containing protein [Pavlovales sp. CCMP2436]